MFTHDLIQQQVYERCFDNISERHNFHLQIGQCLGALASFDAKPAHSNSCIQTNDQIFFTGSQLTSSLIAIACDQIDSVGPDFIADSVNDGLKQTFASWNLSAGQKASRESNSRAAQYYFSKGIALLGRGRWNDQLPLCLALHEGAIFASFSLGEPENVALYASAMTSNTSFDESLDIQPTVLLSLSQSGKHEEVIRRGIDILRQLHFDFPSAPTIESIMYAMANTDAISSQYSTDQLTSLCEKPVDNSVHQVVKTMDAFYGSCYASSSPYFAIVACEMIKYSLQYGISQESTIAFAVYGMLLVRKWMQIVPLMT